MFGVGLPRPVPMGSFALFALRDCATIAASFSIPKKVASQMEATLCLDSPTASIASQLLCPMAVQFISTPLHLLGLDLYNRDKVSKAERSAFVR